MTRLRIVLSRIGLLGIVGVALYASLNPMLRYWMNQVVGDLPVDVKIGRVEHAIPDSSVRLSDVTLFSGHQWDHSQIIAESVTLDLDQDQLLRKKILANNAQLHGIKVRFDTPLVNKHSSTPILPSKANEQALEARAYLEKYLETVKQDLNVPLKTQTVATDIEQRRRRNYLRLERQAKTLLSRIDSQIPDDDATHFNPLRNTKAIRDRRETFVSLRSEATTIDNELQRLAEQYEQDQATLVSAKKVDLKLANDRFRFQPIDESKLTAFLFGTDINQQVLDLVTWIKRGRRFLLTDHEILPTVVTKSHGSLTIDKMTWDDQVEVNGVTVPMKGSLSNVSSSNQTSKPLILHLQLQDSSHTNVEITFDRSTEQPRDRIVLRRVLSPSAQRDNNEDLKLNVSYKQRVLTIDVVLKGDRINGTIALDDDVDSIELDSTGLKMIRLSAADFSSPKSISTVANLSGTIARPDWEIQSDVAQQLVETLNRALKVQLDERRTQSLARINKSFQSHKNHIESVAIALHRSVLTKTSTAQTSLVRSRQQLETTLGLSGSLR